MDDQRFGTAMRQIRIRRRLRQADVAGLAGVSQPTLSRIERGHLASMTLDSVRRVAAVLDVRVDLIARWRAGDLDRLLNARHGQFHELVARRFDGMPGWVQRPEVSFAIYADRGVIDILAFHAASDIVLAIELKTDIADVNELVGTVDRKRRVAVDVAREIGWPVGASTRVAVWVIVAESATNRRRIAAHRAMLRAAFPADGRTVGGWLLRPQRPIRALSIWSDILGQTARVDLRSVRRVSGRSSSVAERASTTARPRRAAQGTRAVHR